MAETNHNRTPSGMTRLATTRESTRLSLEEEDDYDLAAMGISDGFRPTTNVPAGHNRVSSHSSHRDRRSTPPPRPSSMTKPRNLDTFALRHDGTTRNTGMSYRPTTVASSSGAGSITRSSSVSTDNPLMRPESPYQGPTGPSHPYHMYPQNTRLTRTASVATTSTNPGPTYPYGMYPQNTVPESESIHDSIPASSIPVGFPGHGANYQRRLGPDGEEAADIIGPLGHTEQLPPYTKYPDEALTRKVAPILPAGAGGIGLATRDPEFASREDLNSPPSRLSQRSLTSDSDHQINVAAFRASEKPPEKKWKIIAQRKVWGIVPVWVFVLVALIFLGFILIVSIILKIFMHHMSSTKAPQNIAPSATMFTTVTTTYDALSLSSAPTNIPPLPTGTYSLSISTPSISEQSCLDTSSLYSAWSCALPLDSVDVSISMRNEGSDTARYEITMASTYDVPMSYIYGTQPPVIASEQNLILVNDTQQIQWGPAWYFAVVYDKLVVVPEDDLPPPPNVKRSDMDMRIYERSFSQKGVAQTGDKPWFCYWNNTVLETFIYVNQTSKEASASAASASMATSTVLQANVEPISSTQLLANHGMQPSQTTTAPSATTSSSANGNTIPGMFEGYPKVVKLEERRIPAANARLPYCVKMLIQPDGSALPYLDPNNGGSQDVLHLNETEPSEPAPPAKRSLPGTELVDRQTVRLCQCVWLAT